MSDQASQNSELLKKLHSDYEFGFVSEVDQEVLPPGLNEEVIRTISAKKNEPELLLKWRLKYINIYF